MTRTTRILGAAAGALPLLLLTAAPAHAAPTLIDTAPAAGLAVTERTWNATAVDVNGDGLADPWVGYHQRADGVLYRAAPGGTYSPVNPELTPRVNTLGGVFDRHACTWADFDLDGRPDAYCTGGRNESNYVKDDPRDNELWMQQPDGTFLDRGTELGVGDMCGRGRYTIAGDFTGDGWPDLFLGNQTPRTGAQLTEPDPCQDPASGLPNVESKLLVNQQGTGFTYDPAWNVGKPNAGQRCAVTLDLDRDGRLDLIACGFADKPLSLWRNTGGSMVDVAAANGLGSVGVSDAVPADLDGDGWTDLVTAQADGVWLRLNVGGTLAAGKRIITAPAGTTARAAAVADLNGDGRLDLFAMLDSDTGNPDDIAALRTAAGWWTRVTAPAANGRADAVTTVRGADGRDRVLVLNGRLATAGTSQLIGLAP